jgi:hypothetical protein
LNVAPTARYFDAKTNISGISPEALKKVNDYLISQGKKPLDPKDPTQNIAAFWIAASLYYDSNVENPNFPYWDVATAVGTASNPSDNVGMAGTVWGVYAALFDFDPDSRQSDLKGLIKNVGAADLVKGGVNPLLLWPDHCSAQDLVDAGVSISRLIDGGIHPTNFMDMDGGMEYLIDTIGIRELIHTYHFEPAWFTGNDAYLPELVEICGGGQEGAQNLANWFGVDPARLEQLGLTATAQ